MVALFVDMKAVFNSVNRRVLIKAMRERGVRKRLTRRVEELFRKTKCRVRI